MVWCLVIVELVCCVWIWLLDLFVFVLRCAEDAQAHATACQKLFPQNYLLDSLYQHRKRGARRADTDTCTVLVITVTRGTGKYDFVVGASTTGDSIYYLSK